MPEDKEELIRKCVEATAKMIDGSWHGRVDQEDLDCLIRVLAGSGEKKDYKRLKDFGVEI